MDNLKDLLIPAEIRYASADDVKALRTRMYITIAITAVIFAGWAVLLYQSYANLDNLENRFWFLTAAGFSGLVLFLAGFFMESFMFPAPVQPSWLEKLASYQKDYYEVRLQFVKAFKYLMYLTLAFSLVSLALVGYTMSNPLQYLPQGMMQYIPYAPQNAPLNAPPMRRRM